MALYLVQSGGITRHLFKRSPRVVLETDAASAEALPAPVRAAADSVVTASLATWLSGRIPGRADGTLTWLSGDQLLCGSPASLRQAFRVPGRRSFLPVHFPCLEELPLLALQPRCICGGPAHESWDFSVRLASSPSASQQAAAALRGNGQAWAQLSLALAAELATPGSGSEALEQLCAARQKTPTLLAALALRNRIVLQIRRRELSQAERLLAEGLQTYPGYAELCYINAWLHIQQGRFAAAVAPLEKAKAGDRGLLGCGGEGSYRADWLLGLVALQVGNLRVAFNHLRRGLLCHPVFVPAVEQLLRLRLSARLVAAHEQEFRQAAWRTPMLREKIFDFLLAHRAFAAAGDLLAALPLAAGCQEPLQERLRAASSCFHSRRGAASGPPGILFSGPFFEHTSLGRINRELAASIVRGSSCRLRLEPSSCSAMFPRLFPQGERLESAILGPLQHLDLTIRHQWPPDFGRPTAGKLAVVLPWEYGAVPRAWVQEIEGQVDELWVPSHFVRGALQRSGVLRTPIEVLPNGFDAATFAPQGSVSRPQGCRKFAFLFVGGAIRRKGIDLLLDAYRSAFDPGEDVTLVLQVSGTAGSYRHNSLTRRLQEAAADPRAPHLQILSDSLDDATLASLYRGCDAFVLPYRGEGFGMPLLEAMACGKPVITTAAGPAREFCGETAAYFIPAREEVVSDEPPPFGEFAGPFTWFEPDTAELARLLRHVFAHPEEAATRGRAAAQLVRKKYGWEQVAQLYQRRIGALLETEAVLSGERAEVLPA